MKNVCLFLSLLLGLFTPGCEERVTAKLIRFQKNDLWGYKDTSGKVVLKPRYIFARDFSRYGIAAVCDPEQSWIYIDTKGNFVIKPLAVDNGFDEFCEGLARYEENGKIVFFNEKGEKVIKAQYEYAFPFHNGFALVGKGVRKEYRDDEKTYIFAEKWGFIDKNGNLAIPYKFEHVISPFDDPDFAEVVLDGKEVKINRRGEVIGEN